MVPDLPVAIALRDFSHVYLRGPRGAPRDLVRALLAQLATFHAPDDLLIGAVRRRTTQRPRWEWAKWLPHALHPTKPTRSARCGCSRPAVTALEAMLDDVLANRPRFDPAAAAVRPGRTWWSSSTAARPPARTT